MPYFTLIGVTCRPCGTETSESSPERRKHGRCRCVRAAGTKPRRIANSAPVTSRRPLTRRNQHDAAGVLAGARRRSDVTQNNGIDAPTHSPLCANMTSSIKPEVDNVSQRRRKRTIATRPNNNSTYRVAMHNTRTWPIGAACETFRTPSMMLKKTIRVQDEGGWRRRRGLRLRHYSGVSAEQRTQ